MTGEHHATEQLKRIVIEAIVAHSKGVGMAVASRRAADKALALLVPDASHQAIPIL